MNHTRQPYTRDYRRRLRADYDYVVGEVRNALPIDTKILARPQVGFIGWRLGDERFYFYFGPYNEITYRLLVSNSARSELPKYFWMIKLGPYAGGQGVQSCRATTSLRNSASISPKFPPLKAKREHARHVIPVAHCSLCQSRGN